MEAQLKAVEAEAAKPKLDDIKLDGDDVPENLRGKSVRDMINQTKAMEEVLRRSEEGRQQAMILAKTASERGEPVKPEPVVQQEAQITAEQVAEAFQEDATKGVILMNKMTQQSIQRAADHFAQRMDPLITGSVSSAEADARRRYPDEFQLYGEEIKGVIANLPNKNAMSTPKAWDDILAYVRGSDPKRLFDHYAEVERKRSATSAQEGQRGAVGASMSSTGRAPATQSTVVLDDLAREVCRVQGISEEDYIKWSKVT